MVSSTIQHGVPIPAWGTGIDLGPKGRVPTTGTNSILPAGLTSKDQAHTNFASASQVGQDTVGLATGLYVKC